jgi:hypothetical protein
MTVTKKSYSGSYHSDGSFSSNSRPAGNNVVTIDGADVIHIRVTYGAPQNNGGPPSDLAIWAGNHPDYTDADINSALTSCGGVNAVNGAFSSDGNSDTQVTMECDITGDSVTFYDFSTSTNNTVSMGYYAVVTNASKAVISGTYQTPIVESGRGAFLGWSANPNANAVAEEPLYVDGTDFIINAPYTNEDAQVTLYAVWGKTFNAAYTDAGKAQLNNHYKMQDATDAICREVYVGATETLIDLRDNTTYMVGRLKDGKCWMLDNLALDPTNSATAARMNASNTNATQAAIDNLLHGGSSTTGWSSVAVVNSTVFQDSGDGFMQPRINNDSKNTLVTSYGPASSNGQAKVGIYYNFCAASASTYCYANDSGVDVPGTIIDVPQDICPASWRMPTGGSTGEYYALAQKYGNLATKTNSLQYNLSTPLSGYYINSSPDNRNLLGYLWSSTYSNRMKNNFLGTSPSAVDSVSIPRISGLSMRCLVSE